MAGRGRRELGGITGLLDWIENHEAAFAYDWRSRFGLPLTDLFDGSMSWGEAIQLTRELVKDPSSHVSAAIREWAYPMSREALILADTFDLHARVNSKNKPKPYPRPARDRPQGQRSAKPSVSQRVIRAALRLRGH